ncbi:hypothetical protein N2152v2_001318 [Parachlorella kessleri]
MHSPIRRGPGSSASAEPEVTQRVFLDIEVGGRPAGRIVVGLYGNEVPKTVDNFVALATGETGFGGYKGSAFHRVVPNFVLQGGDFDRGNGTGEAMRYVIAAGSLDDTRFFITTADTPWLNGKHVVFGKVLEGMDLVNKLQFVQVDRRSRPVQPVVIADCGVLA